MEPNCDVQRSGLREVIRTRLSAVRVQLLQLNPGDFIRMGRDHGVHVSFCVMPYAALRLLSSRPSHLWNCGPK
jgi:hypothetical protein